MHSDFSTLGEGQCSIILGRYKQVKLQACKKLQFFKAALHKGGGGLK